MNNEEILIDLSSNSSTSESDNNRTSIHYVSKTDQSGGIQVKANGVVNGYKTIKNGEN